MNRQSFAEFKDGVHVLVTLRVAHRQSVVRTLVPRIHFHCFLLFGKSFGEFSLFCQLRGLLRMSARRGQVQQATQFPEGIDGIIDADIDDPLHGGV